MRALTPLQAHILGPGEVRGARGSRVVAEMLELHRAGLLVTVDPEPGCVRSFEEHPTRAARALRVHHAWLASGGGQ